MSGRYFNFVGREDSFRNPVGQQPESRFVFIGEDEMGGEIGADYEFNLGPGRLKLIGLNRYEEGDDRVTVESYVANAMPEGVRVNVHEEAGESILRSEYGYRLFGGDMQWAMEGAFNYVGLATDLGDRQADGSYVLAVLPDGTARVEEQRAETNLSYSRKLNPVWGLQTSLGVEYSKLSQNSAGGQVREFVRPKAFLALVWKASDTLDISLKGERRVGQLDFGDFLSSVDLQQNNTQAGNPDLVPEQSWILSTEANQKLGKWGAVKPALEAGVIEDVVDRIRIGATGSAVGNIDEATAWSASISGTINLDQIGAKGLQFQFDWEYSDSEVEGPLTGITREISYSDKLNGNMSLRWDIPSTTWTLVGGIEEYQSAPGYRLDEISRNWGAPSINFFSIENKDVYGLKVRLQAVNLDDTSENFKREVYQNGRRTNPIDFIEERRRTLGPIVRLYVSGTF